MTTAQLAEGERLPDVWIDHNDISVAEATDDALIFFKDPGNGLNHHYIPASRLTDCEARLAIMKTAVEQVREAGREWMTRAEAAEARLTRAEALLRKWLNATDSDDFTPVEDTRAFLAERKG